MCHIVSDVKNYVQSVFINLQREGIENWTFKLINSTGLPFAFFFEKSKLQFQKPDKRKGWIPIGKKTKSRISPPEVERIQRGKIRFVPEVCLECIKSRHKGMPFHTRIRDNARWIFTRIDYNNRLDQFLISCRNRSLGNRLYANRFAARVISTSHLALLLAQTCRNSGCIN